MGEERFPERKMRMDAKTSGADRQGDVAQCRNAAGKMAQLFC
jgi:hypothetical protein